MTTQAPAAARPARIVLAVVAALLYATGWATAKAVLAVLWIVAAVRLGWSDAHGREAHD